MSASDRETYDELYQNFRWDIPARFNIATACCDRHADGSGRLALVYVDEDGGTFDEARQIVGDKPVRTFPSFAALRAEVQPAALVVRT